MKTLIAISDTHCNPQPLASIKPLIAENDFTVHLGDGFTDFKDVYCEYPKKTHVVKGNCDFFQTLPQETVLEIEECKVLCCHGHAYGVKSGTDRLLYRAQELGCNVALYGHTHRAEVLEMDGVLLVNPGTLKYPLDAGGSYAYLVFNGKKVTAVIVGNPML